MITHDKCAPFEAEISRLKRENEQLRDRLHHEVEMIDGAAKEHIGKIQAELAHHIFKIEAENAKLRECVEHYAKIMEDDYGLKGNSVAAQLLKELGDSI